MDKQNEYVEKTGKIKRLFLFICDQMLALLLPVLLQCRLIVLQREYDEMIKSNKTNRSRNQKFLYTIEKRQDLHYQTIIFKKLEVSLETILQLCGQILLLNLAISETRTLQAFTTLFIEGDVDDYDMSIMSINRNRNEIFNVDNIEKPFKHLKHLAATFVIFSILFSAFSFTYVQVKGVESNRVYFPLKSKLAIGSSALMACVTRVLAMLLYFAPVMGLFNMARHLQGDFFHFHVALYLFKIMTRTFFS